MSFFNRITKIELLEYHFPFFVGDKKKFKEQIYREGKIKKQFLKLILNF